MGLLTVFSGAKQTVGFSSNPLAFAFSKRVKHILSEGLHETDRNQKLIEHLTDSIALRPALYPPKETMAEVAAYKQAPYICLAPASVWFTKQLPEHIWSDLIRSLPESIHVYLIGAPSDKEKCERLASVAPNRTTSLAGKLSLLSSAALLQDAVMCFVNDSAPLHIASAMNTPTCAIYCSTVPAFGFGPLSDVQVIVQTTLDLKCRPCGLHGHNKCPLEHFSCGNSIHIQQLLAALRKVYPMTETD
jgi:heptosyltransferase-2